MKGNQLLGIGLVIGLVFYLTRQAKRIDIGTAALSYFKLAGNGIRMRFKIPVLNRSDISTRIDGFLGSLRYRSAVLGNIVLTQPTAIPPHSAVEPEFEINITYGSIATELWDVLQSKFINIPIDPAAPKQPPVSLKDFRVIGTLYVGGLSVDLDQPIA